MKKKIFYILVSLLLVVANAVGFAEQKTYFIGPGDVLEISVWGDQTLSRQVIVPPDGVVSFPLIGDIPATNLTVTDLRKIVTEKLSEYVPDVTVTVMILQFNSLRAYVIGKVNKPGEFPITMETSVIQILSMAGGLSPFASRNKIFILRQKNGETVRIAFDYWQMLKAENLEQNILLQRGDVVVVP